MAPQDVRVQSDNLFLQQCMSTIALRKRAQTRGVHGGSADMHHEAQNGVKKLVRDLVALELVACSRANYSVPVL